jgi:hypothetical protein
MVLIDHRSPLLDNSERHLMNHASARAAHSCTAMTLVAVLVLSVVGLEAPPASAASTPLIRANAALARATTQLRTGHPGQAIAALKDLTYQQWRAYSAAVKLIGAPPADPESDEPPGPPAVLQVLALEHRIGIQLVPLFNGRTRADVVHALRLALYRTQYRRGLLLNRVIALPPEDARSDYEDGMADTLGQYTQEVQQLSKAVATYRLTSAGRTGLRNALIRVRATKAKVDAAFGGGE